MEETSYWGGGRGGGIASIKVCWMFFLLPSAPNLLSPSPLRSAAWAHVVQSNRALTLWLLIGFAQLGASPGDWREGEK